jgi:hypothetical protein
MSSITPLLSRSVDNALPESELRALLTDLTREARARGLRVEQLLILIKQRWVTSARDQDERRRRERLVTLCIATYYA